MASWRAAFKTGVVLGLAVCIIIGTVALGKGRNADARLRETTRVLCDRADIIADALKGGIAVVKADLADPTTTEARATADRAFIVRFNADLAALAEQTNDPDSPCWTPKDKR